MARTPRAFPTAEAATLDSQISVTVQKMFSDGDAVSADLQALKILIDKRAALLAPPAVGASPERLRTIRESLSRQAQALRAAAVG